MLERRRPKRSPSDDPGSSTAEGGPPLESERAPAGVCPFEDVPDEGDSFGSGASPITGADRVDPGRGDPEREQPSASIRIGAAARALECSPEDVRRRAARVGVELVEPEPGGEATLELADLPQLTVDRVLASLSARLERADADREALRAERDESERALRAVQIEAAEATELVRRLEAELSRSRSQARDLDRRARHATAEASEAGRLLEARRGEEREAAARIEDLERQSAALESAWDEERRTRVQLGGRCEELEARVRHLESEIRLGLDREADLQRRAGS